MALNYSWETFIRLHGGEAGARHVFENLIFDLLRIENPEEEIHIEKSSRNNCGDFYVHHSNGIDIYECKFFMGELTNTKWFQIKQSFERTIELKGVKILRWFLCMPKEIQVEDISWINLFKENYKQYGVQISFIDGNEIISRLNLCDQLKGTNLMEKYFAISLFMSNKERLIPKCLTPIPIYDPVVGLVGREHEVNAVLDMLNNQSHSLLLCGIGGIGKTAIMKYVCNSMKEKGKYVAWIECGSSLTEDLLTLSAALGLSDEDSESSAKKIINILRTQLNEELYLFFDNLVRNLSQSDLSVLNSLNAHIMITSRFSIDGVPTIFLNVLDKHSAITLFYKYYKGDVERRCEDTVISIINSVNMHTLVIELIAKSANKFGGSLDEFAEYLKKEGDFDVFNSKIAINHDNENQAIEEYVARLYWITGLTQAQKHILRLFTIFTPGREIYYKIREWARLDKDAMRELVELGWIERGGFENGYMIHPIVKASLKRQVEDVMLEDYGDLLEKVTDIDNYIPVTMKYELVKIRITLTDDIAEFLWKEYQINTEKDEMWVLKAAALFFKLAGVYQKLGDYGKALEYYGKVLVTREKKLGVEHQDTAATYNNMAVVYSAQGDYEKALEYCSRALGICEKLLGIEHPDTAMTYNNMALVYSYQGDYEKALEYYGKALSINVRVLGTEHPSTAMTYNNMALVYSDKGEYEKALEYYRKALSINVRVLGTEHPSTAMTYNNMALVYSDKGEYEKALEYYGKALSIREKLLGIEHSDTAATYNNIASVYSDQGEYEKALEYYSKALNIRMHILGDNHPETAETYNNMAEVFSFQSDYAKALEYYGKALSIRIHIFGDNHPDIGETYNDMARVYSAQGKYVEALKYCKKALNINEQILGDTHPSMAMTYYNMAVVYYHQGDYGVALEFYEKACTIYERVFGVIHPSTAMTYNNMAVVYYHQGNSGTALEYYKKALDIRERLLGLWHQDTAATYNDMAEVLCTQGDYTKAQSYYEKVLAIRGRLLGAEHPDTARTYNSIGGLCYDQGHYAKALEWYEKALSIFELKLGTRHPLTMTTCYNIGLVYLSFVDYENAEKYFRRVISVYEIEHELMLPVIATSLRSMAIISWKQSEHQKALEYYDKAMAVFKNLPGNNNIEIASITFRIASIYAVQGDSQKALKYINKAQSIGMEEKRQIISDCTIYQKKILTLLKNTNFEKYSKSFLTNLLGENRVIFEDAIKKMRLEGWIIEENGSIFPGPLLSFGLQVPEESYMLNDTAFYEEILNNYLALPYNQMLLHANNVLPNIIENLPSIESNKKLAALLLYELDLSNEQFAHNYPDCNLACVYVDSRDRKRQYVFFDLEQGRTTSFLALEISTDENEINLLKIYNKGNIQCALDFSDIDKEQRIYTIPDMLCYNNMYLTKLVLPEKVEKIGEKAFYGCIGLGDCLILPDTLRIIESEAFCGCRSISGDIHLPKQILEIGRRAFAGCKGLSGDLYLSDSIKKIGDDAFNYQCSCMFESGEVVPQNNRDAFGWYMKAAKSGDMRAVSGLGSVYKDGVNGPQQLASLDYGESCDDALKTNMNISKGRIFFPDNMTEIKNNAFIDCIGLYGELQFGKKIVSIGDWAFKGCIHLSGNLYFPNSIKYIGNNAFNGCVGLNGEIRLSPNLEYIGDYAFKGCESLSGQLHFQESVYEIGQGAFERCKNLQGEVILPDKLVYVNDAVFSGCSGLQGKIKFSKNLRKIGNRAFLDCKSIKSSLDFPDTLSIIGEQAFKNCNGLVGKLRLTESMAFIGDEAFCGCKELTGELYIPESMLSIGSGAFSGCRGLKREAMSLKSYKSREYVRSLLENAEPLKECKVIFLGDGGAGKSYIISRLVKNGEPISDYSSDSTPGIKISHNKETVGIDEFQIHYWDFGGQEIFHSMHRMFMTKRTLYVVVVNARGNLQDESANYWLHDVSIYAPESPVLLIVNQIDQNPAASINEKRLRDMYPQLKKIVKISALNFSKSKFEDELIFKLHELIREIPGVHAPFPVKWKNLFKSVKENNPNYILANQFIKLCKDNEISEYEDISQILIRKIQDLGVGFYYEKIEDIDDTLLLKPTWLLNAIYIILFYGAKFAQNGVLSYKSIEKMLVQTDDIKTAFQEEDSDYKIIKKALQEEKYEVNDVKYILSVIRKFRLSYKIQQDSDFLPMLCDRNENISKWDENNNEALHMVLRYKYKPLDIFHRLIVEMHEDLDMENVWYSGALMKNEKDLIMAFINVLGNDIHVRVKCDNDLANKYLLIIHDQLSEINNFLGVGSEEIVVYQKDGKEAEFYYDDLMGSVEAGIEYIYSRIHKSKIRIKDILYYSDSEIREYHQQLLNTLINALEKLQNNYVYYRRKEDDRNTYVRDLLEMCNYICKDQSRGGLSGTKGGDGERDIIIEDEKHRWATIYEALNVNSFKKADRADIDFHINKLLDNYNPVGYPILYLIVYAEWEPDKFEENKQKYFEYVKSSGNCKFRVKSSNQVEQGRGQYLDYAKITYDCWGIPINVYHIVVRIGEPDDTVLKNMILELFKNREKLTQKDVEKACKITDFRAKDILVKLCKKETLSMQGIAEQNVCYILSK